MKFQKIIIILLFGLISRNCFPGIHIKSFFEPSVLSINEKGRFLVTIEGLVARDGKTQANIPSVRDLQITYQSARSSSYSLNGKVTKKTTYIFKVRGNKSGFYTIPSFDLIVDDKTYVVPSANLTVTNEKNNEQESFASLNIQFPNRKRYFVGESIPFSLNLDFNQNSGRAQLQSFPKKTGDSFSAKEIMQNPDRNVINVNNSDVTRFSWKSLLTPLKTGSHSIEYAIDMLTENQTNDDQEDEDFGLFFKSFMPRMQMSETNVRSTPKNLEIYPLPAEGKPEFFTNCIGKYKIVDCKIKEQEIVENEPVVFLVTIEGEGNFEGLESLELQVSSNDWRQYKPRKTFLPNDSINYEGKLNLEYTLVPLKSGNLDFPKFVLSFFDPQNEKYESISSEKTDLKVLVKPGLRRNLQNVSKKEEENKKSEYFTIFTQESTVFEQMISVKFIIVVQICFAIIVFVVFLFLRQRHMNNNSFYAQKILIKKKFDFHLSKIAEYVKLHEQSSFYEGAENLIQFAIQLTIINQNMTDEKISNNSSLTIEEMTSVLKESFDVPKNLISEIDYFYQKGDLVKFGNSNIKSNDSLNDDYKRLTELTETIFKLKNLS